MDTVDEVFCAITRNDLGGVRAVIETKGVPVNVANREGQTIAHVAASKGHVDILKYVLKKDPSIKEKEDRKRRSVLAAAVELDGSLEVVKYLVEEENADVDQLVVYAMHKYSYGKQDAESRVLYGNIVHRAIKSGRLDILKYFVEERQVNVDQPCRFFLEKSMSLVYVAVRWQQHDILKYLVQEKKANLMGLDRYGENILFEAVRRNHLDSVKYILDERKTPLDINWKNKQDGNTVVHIAVIWDQGNILKYLITQKHADVGTKNKDGNTALHLSQTRQQCKFLLEHGANIDDQNNEGTTPLMFMISAGSRRVRGYLVKHGADLSKIDRNGRTALHLAVQSSFDDDLVKLLIASGADVNKEDHQGETPLHSAIIKNYILQLVQCIINCGGVVNSETVGTAMHLAAARGRMGTLKYLIEAGEKKTRIVVNEPRKKDNWTPLHCAAFSGHFEAVEFLIKHGADITAKDKYGKMPVEVASDDTVIKYLRGVNESVPRNRRSVGVLFSSNIDLSHPMPHIKGDGLRIHGNQFEKVSVLRTGNVSFSTGNFIQNFLAMYGLLVPRLVAPVGPRSLFNKSVVLHSRIDVVAEDAVYALSAFEREQG